MRRLGVVLIVCGALFSGAWSGAVAASPKPPPRSPFNATIALVPDLQARAKQMVIGARDLPKGWEIDPRWSAGEVAKLGPEWSCNGHTADLSGLVVKGAWSARSQLLNDSGDPSLVTSTAVVLASPEQAQMLFDVGRTYYPKYCEIVRKPQPGGVVVALAELKLPHVAEQQTRFRTAFLTPISADWRDFILLRRGPVLGILEFSRPGKPFPARLENAIINTFAARFHG